MHEKEKDFKNQLEIIMKEKDTQIMSKENELKELRKSMIDES